MGHGTRNPWHATDGQVDNEHLKAFACQIERKRGEWFQLTCPAADYSPVRLGEHVMAPECVFTYAGHTIKSYDLVLDALSGFRHIKAENGKREPIRVAESP